MAVRALYWIWVTCVGILVACLVYSCRRGIEGFQELRELPTLIPRTQEPTGVDEIPFDVYQCWNARTVAPGMYDTVTANASANPEFNFHFYDDDMCRTLIQDNFEQEVLDAFDTLKPGAFKADLWRLCVLYKYGGVYMDTKFKFEMPLKDALSGQSYLFVHDLKGNDIYNGFMACKSNEPILKSAISKIVDNVKLRFYGNNCLDITGPTMLGRIWGGEIHRKLHLKVDSAWSHEIAFKDSDKTVVKEYPSYRSEQKSNGTRHYAEMWNNRDIFA